MKCMWKRPYQAMIATNWLHGHYLYAMYWLARCACAHVPSLGWFPARQGVRWSCSANRCVDKAPSETKSQGQIILMAPIVGIGACGSSASGLMACRIARVRANRFRSLPPAPSLATTGAVFNVYTLPPPVNTGTGPEPSSTNGVMRMDPSSQGILVRLKTLPHGSHRSASWLCGDLRPSSAHEHACLQGQ